LVLTAGAVEEPSRKMLAPERPAALGSLRVKAVLRDWMEGLFQVVMPPVRILARIHGLREMLVVLGRLKKTETVM
jgi:hypothetical protein